MYKDTIIEINEMTKSDVVLNDDIVLTDEELVAMCKNKKAVKIRFKDKNDNWFKERLIENSNEKFYLSMLCLMEEETHGMITASEVIIYDVPVLSGIQLKVTLDIVFRPLQEEGWYISRRSLFSISK